MKKFLIIYTALFAVSGCATLKTPQINGTNRNEGLVDLSFTYGLLERPKVNWEQAESTTVTQQCLSWGYQKPSASSEVVDECTATNQNGKCIKHAVSKRYQCELSSQQRASKIEEENRKAKAKKVANMNAAIASGEFSASNIGTAAFSELCKQVTSVANVFFTVGARHYPDSGMPNVLINTSGYGVVNLLEINKQNCSVRFNVNGVYQGTTVNRNINCFIAQIKKQNQEYIAYIPDIQKGCD